MCKLSYDWSARFGAADAHGSVPIHFTTRNGCALTPRYVATGRPAAVQNPRPNSCSIFVNRHRARAPAVEKHPVLGPGWAGTFASIRRGGNILADGQEQKLARPIDRHRSPQNPECGCYRATPCLPITTLPARQSPISPD